MHQEAKKFTSSGFCAAGGAQIGGGEAGGGAHAGQCEIRQLLADERIVDGVRIEFAGRHAVQHFPEGDAHHGRKAERGKHQDATARGIHHPDRQDERLGG